jgi:DNA polymerase I
VSTEKKLILLDAMALIYRAHFALIRSPRFTSRGLCTSAIFGLTNTLLDILGREPPTHLAAALDTADPTLRHQAFPDYKAHRDEMPEDLADQLPWIDRLLEAFSIPIIRVPGYEADDIIGTLAHQAADKGFKTLMVTPDKDFDQLVSPNVCVWKPGRQGGAHELFDVPQVLKKWDIQRVDQVIDILALMGDSSDNIPGVPGIGPKTATKLIQQFGSMEKLLASTDQLKGKQRENVEQFAEQARLSKELVTIHLEVPHSVNLCELRWQGYDQEKLSALFEELEFRTLAARVFGSSTKDTTASDGTRSDSSSELSQPSKSQPSKGSRGAKRSETDMPLFGHSDVDVVSESKSIDADYSIVSTESDRAALIRDLLSAERFAFDIESTSLDPRHARPLGIAFALRPNVACYVVLPSPREEMLGVLDEFRPVFGSTSITKIGHNLKYDLTILRWQGLEVSGPVVDTMLAHMMGEPDAEHGLDRLAQRYLNHETTKIEELIGPKGPGQRNMADVPVEQVGPYACEDADVALELSKVLLPFIEQQGLSKVCYEVEFPLTRVLVDMEAEGIRLDSQAIEKFSVKLEIEISQLEEKIFRAAGRRFNIDSPKQLGTVLYDELRVEANPKKTATGQYSTREAELERLVGRHEIVSDVLEYRNATKLKRTYVDQLPGFVDATTGRLHTNYSQAWTATGRMQSVNPNLQTIPIRKERGREIRAAFVPRNEEYWILSADYSQIELRVMAALSGDPALLEAFASNEDIHAATASKVFGVPVGLVTREMRAKAKMVNFGILYGISSYGLQQRLNIPREEATALIENYFLQYPQVKKYIQETIEFARKNGYVQTQTGRRRYLREINSRSRTASAAAERLAMNSPIQGTAADILKLAMIRVHKALQDGRFRTRMLLTVHDEIVFDLYKTEADQVLPVIRHAMTEALPMQVPLVVEMGYGENWLEAH